MPKRSTITQAVAIVGGLVIGVAAESLAAGLAVAVVVMLAGTLERLERRRGS